MLNKEIILYERLMNTIRAVNHGNLTENDIQRNLGACYEYWLECNNIDEIKEGYCKRGGINTNIKGNCSQPPKPQDKFISENIDELLDAIMQELATIKLELLEANNACEISINRAINWGTRYDALVEENKKLKLIESRYIKLKQILAEVSEIAKVTPINTCWTIINNCDECSSKAECEDSSPFVKLKAITHLISDTLKEMP